MTSAASPSLAQGLHGAGGGSYDWRELQAVLAAVESARQGAPLTVEELVGLTGVPGRTVRAALSDADGERLLPGGGSVGYFVCDFADDGDAPTSALKSQIASMTARVERRDRLALALPQRQGTLF